MLAVSAALPAVRPTRRRLTLRRGLAVGALAVGAAVVVYPFLPLMRYAVAQPAMPRLPYPVDLPAVVAAEMKVKPAKAGAVVPRDNRLVIPSIGVNLRIVDGPDEKTLWRGAWRIPGTSTPNKGGNTVVSAHRWQYRSGSNTLYLADKVKKGDLMVAYWNGKPYTFRVTEKKLVAADADYIQAPSAKPKLTVYTCAPLFSTKQRLVLVGEAL